MTAVSMAMKAPRMSPRTTTPAPLSASLIASTIRTASVPSSNCPVPASQTPPAGTTLTRVGLHRREGGDPLGQLRDVADDDEADVALAGHQFGAPVVAAAAASVAPGASPAR